jgi:Ca2+-binding EF-hand superfamily protein
VLGRPQLLREQFRYFDPDQTGHITYESLALALPALNVRATPPIIHQLIAEVDTNQNGLIEFDEFLRVRGRRANEGRACVCAASPCTCVRRGAKDV